MYFELAFMVICGTVFAHCSYWDRTSRTQNRGSSPNVYSDVGIKQEGESCGSCFSPSSNYDCGKCISGLECVPDENAHLLPDLPSRCRVPQKVGIKQVGETCGACFDPSNNFDCGNCVEGLYCVADENADILPDLPSRCRVTRVVPRTGGQIGDDCGPCSDSSKNFDCGDCDKSKGLECLPPQGPTQDSTPTCQLRLPPPPFLGNSSIVLTPIDCCFRYGFGARATPCCLETITCDEHDKLVEENKVNPIVGGGFGKHKICPKDAEEAHRLVSDSESSCCFRYGFGARMVPCCMEVITCDEHSEILKQIEENGPMVGGAIGKHQTCPNDAAHAHQLASGEDEVSCYDECLGSGKGPRQCSFECSGDDDLEPPYDKLTYCNKGKDNGEAYCKEQTNGEFNHCWELGYVGRCLINNEEQDNCEGICIPKDIPCESNDDCKDIGSIHSGSVLASCRNNVCEYSKGIAIA